MEEIKVFDILKSGGIWILPIVACAVIATFIIIERFIYYKSIEKNEKQILSDIKELVKKEIFLVQRNIVEQLELHFVQF